MYEHARTFFCPGPRAWFEIFKCFFDVKIKCFHAEPGKNKRFVFKSSKPKNSFSYI